MNESARSIGEDRPLTPAESELVQWLLDHGNADARKYLSQVADARVVSRCPCGCASVNFAIRGQCNAAAGMTILSDYGWKDSNGNLFGVFVFATGDLLGGLEVGAYCSQDAPRGLPSPTALEPMEYSQGVG